MDRWVRHSPNLSFESLDGLNITNERITMKEEFISTRNYIKMKEAFQDLMDLPATAPKMGLGYGNYGLGKTFGLEMISSETGALLLRAVQTWSKSAFLSELCIELNLDTSGQSSAKYKRVVEALIEVPRVLIVDEIDALLRSTKYDVLETIRDIHDEAGICIFMVGMEEANAKLKKHRHFYSRIVNFVKFQEICKEDIKKLCDLAEIDGEQLIIKDDLVNYFTQKRPNLRDVTVRLLRLEKYCLNNDIEEVSLETYIHSGVENAIKEQ